MYPQTAIAQDNYPAVTAGKTARRPAQRLGSLLLRRCPVKHTINLVIDRLDAH
jgi:hypothetical protein